jgi:phosphohistidine swiveling domain-containing protein
MDSKKALDIIKEKGLFPATRRDLPLLTMSIIGIAYHKMMKKHTGFSYSAVGAVGDANGFLSLFNEQEIIDGTEVICNKGKDRVYSVLKKADANFEAYLKQSKKIDSIKNNEKKLLFLIKVYPDFMVSLAVYNCFWRYFGNEESKGLFSIDDVNRISAQRQRIAEEYPRIEEKIRTLANVLQNESKFDFSAVRFLTTIESKKFILNKSDRKKLTLVAQKRKKSYFYLIDSDKETVLDDSISVEQIKKHVSDPFSGYVKYLERKNSLLVFSVSQLAHTKLLSKATGFGYSSLVYSYGQNTGTFYYSKEEKEYAREYFSKLVLRNDSKLVKFYNKGEILADKMNLLLAEFSSNPKSQNKYTFSEIIDSFSEMFLYTTVIPFTVLSGAEKALEKENSPRLKKIIADFESIRNSVEYPKFVSVVIHPYLDMVAKKLNTTSENASLLTFGEMKSVLDKNESIDLREVLKRNEACFCRGDFSKTKFMVSTDPKLVSLLVKPIEGGAKEIVGKSAFPGLVMGKVRIVNTVVELKNFKAGEVLVSISTNPSLMSALSSAAAIVTDEGGIMCHAAIIARELKKPCIIGTKNATKILKDGDTVEVDANRGIVKVL